jgi:hypothetical protein
MALTLDKSVLEKIEALQNIMLASVTGGARDEAEYRQIREELFRLLGLKEALPRFHMRRPVAAVALHQNPREAWQLCKPSRIHLERFPSAPSRSGR